MSYKIFQRLVFGFSSILLSLLLFIVSSETAAQSFRSQEAKPWQGGSFQDNEGAFLFQVLLNRNLTRLDIEQVIVRLYLPVQARYYTMTYRPQLQVQGATQVWRIPQGNYKLHDIEFRSSKGRILRWDGNSPQSFNVYSGRLINAGRWYAIALPNQTVRMIFREQGSSTSPAEQPNTAPSTQAEAGAGSGASQENRVALESQRNLSAAGRPLATQAGQESIARPRGDNQELRAVYDYQRKLDMIYQIDLLRQNHLSQQFARAMNSFDQDFRQCFMDRFADFDTFSGTLRFRFAYSAREQAILNLTATENTMGDAAFVECMYWKILAIRFQAQENIVGEFTFQFHLRSQ